MAINLWQGISAQTVAKSVKDYKVKAESSRKEYMAYRLCMFYDNFKKQLDAELRRQFSPQNYENKVQQTTDTTDNVFKKTINMVSNVYTKPVMREFIIPGKEKAKESDFDPASIYGPKFSYDNFMSTSNRLTNAMNDLILFPAWNERDQIIKPMIITPDIVGVVQRFDDPTELEALWYEVQYIDTVNEIRTMVFYWDHFSHFVYDDANGIPIEIPGNPDNINPYKDENGKTILPFVFLHRDPVPQQFWNTSGGDDLYSGTLINGTKRTFKNYLAKCNSFKRPALIGDQGADSEGIKAPILHDPLEAFDLEVGADVKILDFTADFDGLNRNIVSDINALLETYGLSTDNFSKMAKSAEALEIENSSLRKFREDQIPIFRTGEQDFFNVSRIVANQHKPNSVGKNIELKLNYPEMSIYASEAEEKKADWEEVQKGTLNLLGYVMKYEPDIKTREEAQKFIDNNLVDLNKYKKEKQTTLDILNSANGNNEGEL